MAVVNDKGLKVDEGFAEFDYIDYKEQEHLVHGGWICCGGFSIIYVDPQPTDDAFASNGIILCL